jgi:lipoprotein-anchoring transpeptidase ErfK/SrfK
MSVLAAGFFAKPPDAPAPRLLEAERRLSELGYRILKIDGVADASTVHAIVAFQKVEGLKRTGKLDAVLLEKMRAAQRPTSRYWTGAVHVEVDLARQVLFFVDEEAIVKYTIPISSGNEKYYYEEGKRQKAHTPRGRFKIVRKINGVRKAPLGSLYYPSYIYAGIAIHGSNSVPAYPASHGCIRIPRFADREVFAMAPIGMEVMVYDQGQKQRRE